MRREDELRNMRIKLFEEFGNTREIDINISGGNVFGVLHSRREYFENWLLSEKTDDKVRGFFSMFPDKKLLPIAILKNMNVVPSMRNKGKGDDLMRAFLEEASDARNVVLIADMGESNKFDIARWYEGWGFNKIGLAGGNPVMVLNNY